MEFDLNEIVLLGGAGFLVGLLLLGVTWSISATIGRKKMNRTKEEKQKVMMGLDRSCEGIESVISSVDLGSMDLMQFRSELVRRVNALHSRLEQFADGLEQYFTQYIMLRIENYAQIIDKIDDLGAMVGKYGNPQGALIQEEDSVDLSDAGPAAPVSEAPPAAPVPVDEPAFVEAEQLQAPQPQPQQPQAPAEPQLQQVDDDEEEIMTFDIPTHSDQGGGMDLSSAPTLEMPMPSLEEQEQPAETQQAPPPPPPQQQQAPAQAGMGEDRSLSDDDLMYGQTMQFSMQDIEAARRGEQPPQPQPQQPQQAQQFPNAGELGETFVFASDDGTGQQPPAPPPPQQPKPIQPQSKKKDDGQIISGDDLMQQMDSFFNFGD